MPRLATSLHGQSALSLSTAGLRKSRMYQRSVSVLNLLEVQAQPRTHSQSNLLHTVVANSKSCQPGDCFEIDLSFEHIGCAGLNRIIACAMGVRKPPPPKAPTTRRRQRKAESAKHIYKTESAFGPSRRSYLTLLNLRGNSLEPDLRALVDFLNPPSSPTHGQLPTSPNANKILRRHTYVTNQKRKEPAPQPREPVIS